MSAPLRFDEIARELQTGREIEFTFDGKHYSITNNSSGRWCLCVDTNAGSFLLEDLCPFGQLELLTTKIADTVWRASPSGPSLMNCCMIPRHYGSYKLLQKPVGTRKGFRQVFINSIIRPLYRIEDEKHFLSTGIL